MENIPEITLSDITPDKLANIEDGTKVFDVVSKKYYEKIDGAFEVMVEEEDKTDDPNPLNLPKPADMDGAAIKKIVASGDKLMEVNAYMQMASVKNQLQLQKDTINQKVNFMFTGTDDQMDIMDLRVAEATEESIKNATMEEIKPFFTFDDKFVGLNIPIKLPENEELDAYRDYLLYIKSITDAKAEIDKQVKEIDTVCSNFSEELKEKAKSMYAWDKYIYDLFKERVEDPKISEEERKRIKRLIEIRDEAISLKPLHTYVENEITLGRRKSLIHAFNTRFDETLAKCEQYAGEKNFHVYFQLFDGIEENIGYGEYRNLFIYIFARWIKFNRERLSKMDNAFIAQISQNLMLLKKNQMEEPNKTRFTTAISSILDLIIGTH